MTNRSAGLVIAVAVTLLGTTEARSQKAPTVRELLAAAAKYIADYDARFAVVVSEENYEQTATIVATGRTNRLALRSDVMTIDAGSAGWVSFRDVFEVDGVSVRDRSDRLAGLITTAPPDAFDQATRLASESARFNLGTITRTINTPTVALLFLRSEYQSRSAFRLRRMATVNDAQVAELTFKEEKKPRVIRSADDAAAEGTFWIEPGSGRVIQTELTLRSVGYPAKIMVRYAHEPGIGLWVPKSMDEEYKTPPVPTIIREGPYAGTVDYQRDVITGHADYLNFRQFKVNTRTIIK